MSPRLRHFAWLLAIAPLVLTVPLAAPAAVNAVVTLPQGFTESDYMSGFGGRLTTMTFAPDGRLFVSEKQGSIRIIKDGTLLATDYLTLPTSSFEENGVKGIAFDPNYGSSQDRFVYVFYTDPVTLKDKVSRFTTSSNEDVGDRSSELVLIDGIDTGVFHNGGALHFGSDGKLYVSTGDGAYAPNGQNLANLNGKILRINRDGSVPSDNPFVGQAGARPEIWAYGLRNPFTFDFDATGRMYINDVGNATWEEINRGARGANFGWPTCEGVCGDARFSDPIYAYHHADGPGKSITGAAFYEGSMFPAEYSGDFFFGDYVGNYIKSYDLDTGTVSNFATNTPYPVDLDVGPDGALYYLSVESQKIGRIAYGEEPPPPPPSGNLIKNPGFENSPGIAPWIFSIRNPARASFSRDTSQQASGAASLRVEVTTASSDWHVQALQPDIPLVAGTAHTLTFAARAGSNRNIRAAFQRDSAPYPTYFQRSFALTPSWQTFSAVFTPSQDDARALLVLNLGVPTGQLWIDDISLTAAPVSNGQPPTAVISAPLSGTTFRAGDTISFSGSATDPEDGDLSTARLTWEVLFHHDTHTHPFIEPFSGASGGSFVAPQSGEAAANIWYRIHLTAVDSAGNRTEVTRDVTARTATVTLASQPSGLSLTLDGSPVTAPHSFVGVIGFRRELTAPSTQTLGGREYRFVSWSDNGARVHTIDTPSANTTYTAVYEEVISSNVMQNAGFETTTQWPRPWNFKVRSPAASTVTRDTQAPRTGAASARINVNTASLDWHVQLNQANVPLVAGTPHTFTFAARASSARNIRLAFQRDSSPYTTYFQRTFAITTSWQLYTVTFTPSVSDATALFSFNVGSLAGSIWLDDVSLTR